MTLGIKTKEFFFLLFASIVFGYWIYIKVLHYRDKKDVLRDYSHTTGWIVSYYKGSLDSYQLLTYKYFVKGRAYFREISPRVDFTECNRNFKFCADKRFVVIYSKKRPSKSLIDLRHELKDSMKSNLSIFFPDSTKIKIYVDDFY
jgi:hypothetical protein